MFFALFLLPGHRTTGRLAARTLRAVGWAAVGWTSVVLPIVGYAVWRSSPGEFVRAVFTHVVSVYGPTFVGFTRWGGVMWVTNYVADYTWPWLSYLVPIAILIEAGSLLMRVVRHRGREEAIRAALLLLAVSMAAAIFYFPDLIHVSFIVAFSLIVAAGLVSRARLRVREGPTRRAAAILVAAGILIALAKGWRTVELARSLYPVRYESAFGTIAGTEGSRRIHERVQAAVSGVPGERRTLFSYPNDASLYLTLPGDNPTPFSLLIPGYNTPEQFRIAFDALERRRPDYVIVGILSLGPKDPLMKFLEGRYVRHTGLGLADLGFVYTPAPR